MSKQQACYNSTDSDPTTYPVCIGHINPCLISYEEGCLLPVSLTGIVVLNSSNAHYMGTGVGASSHL